MSRNLTIVVLVILFIGILYRLALTANGNFLFNMDNARDMVDVREMVVLPKLRLIGPTSAIEGFYNGPAWYYLLAIPFVLSGGDPYTSILMEILLWAIGGFFLLKLVNRWSSFLVIPIGAIWIASNYIVLTNLYAFNPNPVTLLSPLFIYLLVKYLENGKVIYVISAWFLGGLFFNFEMNFGIFIPLIILASVILTKNLKLLKQKGFWVGVGAFALTLLPQIIFDLRHQFIMSRAILRHLSENSGNGFNFLNRFQVIASSFYDTFLPILMNHKMFTGIILLLSVPLAYNFIKEAKKDKLVYVSMIFIAVPFLGYLILPVTVNPWHLGGDMAVSLILIAYLLKKLMEGRIVSKLISVALSISIVWFGLLNIGNFFLNDLGKPNLDPSLYKNEISAIDYVYQKAAGQNFKVYTYLPSVYDYPYQYLFWWYGQKKYGYIPGEYVYSPNKPTYIPSQEKFQGVKDNFSGLIFLIKEPDRIQMRQAWENDFKDMEFVSKEMLGSLELEVRREVKK
ncbi:hypothetical protein A2867_01090 [Candidatus Daviesbacteria bacterium RIFCSPHIGHO2_01_FULL_40_11]|uniref:Uncharacterized protein n=1 Tax=Candidatus Daviesbacteria bacterium RIFCSPHIGHO2_01_FULL_40_11 TaxID=1797762 RepID=A0A1F5JHK5_9BACT|nr:MAG: hypothetical protein A2867_01090 [Candidatus Daviesbacteria bacterium RIFCSPHIGHO2_01_FULL_40_11]OGE63091.1 MAG: hypothetical protein A2964_03235 [Candidatus Daviesbacteria bacterium RIFCSPLOWO2_01_FULL_40_27]